MANNDVMKKFEASYGNGIKFEKSLGAEAQNIDVSYDAEGNIIEDIRFETPASIKSLSKVLKTFDDGVIWEEENFLGAKNLIPIGESKDSNGIHFEVTEEGVIEITGIATGTATYKVELMETIIFPTIFTIDIYGDDTSILNSRLTIKLENRNSVTLNPYFSGSGEHNHKDEQLHLNQASNIKYFEIVIENGGNFSDGTFEVYPMLRASTIKNREYVPFSMTNQQLTNQLKDMVGATEDYDGEHGFVPAPTIADKDKYLKGDGSWGELDLSDRMKVDGSNAASAVQFLSKFAVGNSIASGTYSFAQGTSSKAEGNYSQATGNTTRAVGTSSHAEGANTTANGNYSHAEGRLTLAGNEQAHAEGYNTKANGVSSHAEGNETSAQGNYSHVEGSGSTASGIASHSGGFKSLASGNYSFANGAEVTDDWGDTQRTAATGIASHASGGGSTASGNYSNATGWCSIASGDYSHAEGNHTTASNIGAHAEGTFTEASGEYSHVEGWHSNAYNYYSHAEGRMCNAYGESAHAEGVETRAAAWGSHSEGSDTSASGKFSHAEGNHTTASEEAAHSEGYYTTASGYYSHTEGMKTLASNYNAHAEGEETIASGSDCHAEGFMTRATGDVCHAEGYYTTASGNSAHAEGYQTLASGSYSHAEGYNTKAYTKYSHVGGNGISSSKVGEFVHGYRNTNLSYNQNWCFSYVPNTEATYSSGIQNVDLTGGSGWSGHISRGTIVQLKLIHHGMYLLLITSCSSDGGGTSAVSYNRGSVTLVAGSTASSSGSTTEPYVLTIKASTTVPATIGTDENNLLIITAPSGQYIDAVLLRLR